MPLPSVCSCPRIVPNPDNSSGQHYRLIAVESSALHVLQGGHQALAADRPIYKPIQDGFDQWFNLCLYGEIPPSLVCTLDVGMNVPSTRVISEPGYVKSTSQSKIHRLYPMGLYYPCFSKWATEVPREVQWPLRSLRTIEN